MESADIISRIFWPSDLSDLYVRRGRLPGSMDTKSGYIVGWNYRSLICVVLTIVPEEAMPLSKLESQLREWGHEEEKGDQSEQEEQVEQGATTRLWDLCSGPPIVLGRWIMSEEARPRALRESREVANRKRVANLWVVMKQSDRKRHGCFLPQQLELYCCGYRYRTVSQVVVFNRIPLHSSKFLSYSGFDCASVEEATVATQKPDVLRSRDSITPATSPQAHSEPGSRPFFFDEEEDDEAPTARSSESSPPSPLLQRKSDTPRASLQHDTSAGPLGIDLDPLLRQISFQHHVEHLLMKRLQLRSTAGMGTPSTHTDVDNAIEGSPEGSGDDGVSIRRRRVAHPPPPLATADGGTDDSSSDNINSNINYQENDNSNSKSNLNVTLSKPFSSKKRGSCCWVSLYYLLIGLSKVAGYMRVPLNWPIEVSNGLEWLVGGTAGVTSVESTAPEGEAEEQGLTLRLRIRLRDRSALARQLDLRLTALHAWPLLVHRVLEGTQCPHEQVIHTNNRVIVFNAHLVRLWDSVWRMLVDLLAGLCLGCLLWCHPEAVSRIGHQLFRNLHSDVLSGYVTWLMGLPAGMKLNEELNKNLGSAVLFGLKCQSNVVSLLFSGMEPYVLASLACVGSVCGASLLLGLAMDMLNVTTFHLTLVHIAFTRLYAIFTSALNSLWKLFRGKKRNVLRHRIDNCSYDLDQLVVGTILFTLLFFLLPTVCVYYLFFSSLRLFILLFECSMLGLINFFNHFPFYLLGASRLDRFRFPGGVWWEVIPGLDQSTTGPGAPLLGSLDLIPKEASPRPIQPVDPPAGQPLPPLAPLSSPDATTRSKAAKTTTYFELRMSELPLATILSQYLSSLGELAHFNPGGIFLALVEGRPLPAAKNTADVASDAIEVPSVLLRK